MQRIRASFLIISSVLASLPASGSSPEATKALKAAFNAVKRVPLVSLENDGYQARRLDAEKALDAAKDAAESPEDKRLYSLLNATMESRSLARLDLSYGDLAIQCTREAFLAFSPDDLDEVATTAAKKATCLADYKKAVDAIRNAHPK